jgi:uncharacterized membrane protein YfcA
MGRFGGRPWLAAAFATFVIGFLASFIYIPFGIVIVPLGLAFLTLDMSRPAPLPPIPSDDETAPDNP